MKEKKTVDMNLWGLYLAFDVMGEAAYERGFGIIKTGIPHPACEMQRNTMGFFFGGCADIVVVGENGDEFTPGCVNVGESDEVVS
jgi:hypothetical protein